MIRIASLFKIKRAYLILCLPLGLALSYMSVFFPDFIERYYSTEINRFLVQLLSQATGWMPFSLAELLIVILIGATIAAIIKKLFIVMKTKKVNRVFHLTSLLNLLACLSVIYLVFILLWGLNYSRLTFADIAHLNVKPATTDELANVCELLIDRTNKIRDQVEENQQGVMQLPAERDLIFTDAMAGYGRAASIYPELQGRYGPAKGVLFSEPMSYLGISGIYFPFTGEANVNMAIPDAFIPCTVCHEMAHQRGFAREDEANYIAYLTCKNNPDPNFQYSGHLLAVLHSMKMLKQYDLPSYLALKEKYNRGVREDIKNFEDFWQEHESYWGEISNKANDLYLKSNRQNEGVHSYNRMVDLLIAEFRSQ